MKNKETLFIQVVPSGSSEQESSCDSLKLWVNVHNVQLIALPKDSTPDDLHIILTLKNDTRYDLYNDIAEKALNILGISCCCGECIEIADEYAGEATSGC